MPSARRARLNCATQESRDAYQTIKPTIREAHTAILDALRLHGPMTSREIERLELRHQRLPELAEMGRITKTGQRRNGCAVWALTPEIA